MIDTQCRFYICTVCFRTSETALECHGHRMVHCDGFLPGDPRLKPVMSRAGELKTRAPRWFWEQVQPAATDEQ
ncbi:MAG: hypothetical protein L0332_08455 [Chloroflexi bacterium]|nr:hypothetical protein [Chloroflexota bacterium]MCI0576368.1 hypothetical protein [Chloroflexota bacterium]MCI0646201.1 hypothetical protein [Chloroflexota bacterium]MCI0726737.1 hypothetical protein [Chloroflexota bacterium]